MQTTLTLISRFMIVLNMLPTAVPAQNSGDATVVYFVHKR